MAHLTRDHHTVNVAIVLWRNGAGYLWREKETWLIALVASQVEIALKRDAAHGCLVKWSTVGLMTCSGHRFVQALHRRSSTTFGYVHWPGGFNLAIGETLAKLIVCACVAERLSLVSSTHVAGSIV